MNLLMVRDPGELQEEAPSLGAPALVRRELAERAQAVAEGCLRLVGVSGAASVLAATELPSDRADCGAATGACSDSSADAAGAAS